MIAQAESSGQVRVLASFASDGMSLRRHIETTVRPWLAKNAAQVFSNRRLLLGTHDDTDSWELVAILEELNIVSGQKAVIREGKLGRKRILRVCDGL